MTATAYDAAGQPLSVTGPTGAVTDSTWDFLGRKLTSTQVERDTGSGTAAYTTSYAYNASSNDPGGTWPSSLTSADGVSAGYGHDAAGEETWFANGAGDVTDYWYDALGRQEAVINPDGTVTGTSFNVQGEPVSQEKLNANWNTLSTTSWTYNGDGNKTSATDAAGNTTTFSYDATGLLTKEVQPVSASSSVTTSFGYDAAGNQTRYTDGNGSSWYDTYNSWGLQESRVEPATAQYTSAADSTFTTSYNADRNPVTLAEPGGVTITSSYNKVGELTGQSGAGADAATPARSFGYDAAGNMTSASTSNTAPSGSPSNATSETFTYNDRGLVLTAAGSAGATSYTYNGDGQAASVADAAGTTSYTYDSTGRLATLADPATGTTLSYSYTPDSQVSGISYGSGNDTRSFGYDSLHRLTSDTLATASGTTVASVSYGYDANGQVTSQDTTGLAGPPASTYTYDQAGRLTSWNNGTATVSYAYDANGNLTQNGSTAYTYDARDELTSDGAGSYAYTARGTPSSESSPSGTVAAGFDAYGDQASVGTSSYAYDALGRLTAVAPATGSASQFSYAGSTGTIASDGAAAYTWDPSGSTLIAAGAPGGGGGSLALTNSHGDVTGQFTAASAALSGSRSYGPWGTVTAAAGTLTGQLGYQSSWADAGTGKALMGARWYAPGTGSFTSADTIPQSPVPDPAAGNPFAYAAGDPLGSTDPTGHMLIATGGGTAPPPAVVPQPVCSPYNMTPCELQAYLIGGGQVNNQGIPNGKGYVPPPPPEKKAPTRKTTASLNPKDQPASCRLAHRCHINKFNRDHPVFNPWHNPLNVIAGFGGTITSTIDLTMCSPQPLLCVPAGLSGYLPSEIYNRWVTSQGIDTSFTGPYGFGEVTSGLLLAIFTDGAGAVGAAADATGVAADAATAAADAAATAAEDVSLGNMAARVAAACGGRSFTAGTRVLLASGAAVPISQLKPGDKVLAYNGKAGKDQPEAVTAVLVHHDTDLYDLKVKTPHGTEVIHTTASHLFWDPYPHYGWTRADHLKSGEKLKTSDGQTAVVVGGSTPAVHDGLMWDLTVPGNNDHDFYVLPASSFSVRSYQVQPGSTPVLVHNDGPDPWLNAHEWTGGRFPLGGAIDGGGPSGGILYRTDTAGNITNYALYDSKGIIIQRVDLTGAAHGGVPTPHVQSYTYDETPNGKIFPRQLPNARPAGPGDMPPAGC